ncbi:MAG: hypothetical protein NTW16_00805 [Bacteroidetes bacterium]|nr:hypothetical protein [Bacteroidota bacterium]
MIPLFHRKDKFSAWRKSLAPGDPVAFEVNSGIWQTGNVVEVRGRSYFIVVISNSGYKNILLLHGEVFPIDEISQAPQRCDLGLTRPTVIHQVDHSGQRSRERYRSLPGLRWLFSFPEAFFLFPLRRQCNRKTIDPGGNSERG